MSRRLIVVAASLIITLIAGVAAADSHWGPPEGAGMPKFLTGDPADLPPGLLGRDPLPPGLEKKVEGWIPPGLEKKDPAGEPPGQAKKLDGWIPPGLEKKDPPGEPPGQAKKANS